MIGNNIHLGKLINDIANSNGRVTIVDPIYDEVREVTHFDTAHNLEMFFACIDGAEYPEITAEDLITHPSDYDEIKTYCVYAFMKPSDDFRSAVPVMDCSVAGDGRLLLFV